MKSNKIKKEKEKIVQINGTNGLIALTNKGNLYSRTPDNLQNGKEIHKGEWSKIDLPNIIS